ncbi:MAG: cytochrome c biogenesis protein ResB [Syntrophorhabdales bacterium]|jgi:cytochrome c biogenesis protein
MTVTRSSAAEGKRTHRTSPVDTAYGFLSSIRFTIFVLSFIAVSCIIGTLVPQQAPARLYLEQYAESTYQTFTFLGLTDVFHAPWFLCLTGLFVINLVLCTLRRLVTELKSHRPGLPDESALSAMAHTFLVEGKEIGQVAGLFRGYRKTGDERGMILEKGTVSRYAVYIIHGSIVLILLGSLIGLMFGYRGSMTLGKGETRDAFVTRGAHGQAPLGFAIRLDDFRVRFYPGGEPKDYTSRVEIIDSGKVVRTADVRVNHPLSYKGTSIYQASYGSDPVFLFDIGGEEVRLGQGGLYKKGDFTFMVVRFEPSIHNFGPGVQIAYLEGGERKTSWFVRDVPRLSAQTVMHVPVRLTGMGEELTTGLEVSRDPGIWVVWAGFALILLGLYSNFFTYYRRIYLMETSKGVLVAGRSPKNREAFGREFETWREKAHDME